jgi:hypothetical protein
MDWQPPYRRGWTTARRLTFAAGEAKPSAWMADNAYVT